MPSSPPAPLPVPSRQRELGPSHEHPPQSGSEPKAEVTNSPRGARLRAWGATLALLASAAFFLFWVQRFTGLRHWLSFRYAFYWALALCFFLAAVSLGHWLSSRLLPRALPLDERLVLSVATGVLGMGVSWFLLGIAGLLSGWTFCLLPIVCFALGARSLWELRTRYRRHAALFRRTRAARPPSWLRLGLGAFGVLAVGLLYAGILTPETVAYDARWYHLAAAEQYAVQGAIRPFADGWFVGAYPQLATWLYAWAFSLPSGKFFDHVELAAHLEFLAFACTLFGIPVLVRRLLGGGGYGLSWVVRFFFPGVFLYDSGLGVGADHIAAFWAVPIFLAFLRAYERLELRFCLLLCACLAGALLTKYSALGLVVFPGLALVWRAAQLGWRRRRTGAAWLGPPGSVVAMLLAGLILTAPHWLKNWVWYHDPIYPLAYRVFSPRPWTVDSADRFVHFMPAEWSAPRSLQGVRDTLLAMLDFSFVPHDWPVFHGDVPVFGSLFTLAIPCLLFLKPRWRVWALFACCHVAIGVWYWMFHQDRYLQTLLPWMAAGTAAVGIGAWRLGLGPRLALGLLVAAQLAWGGDTPFIPAHAMAGGTPFKPAIELLSSSYRADFKRRFKAYAPLDEVQSHVTPGGTVMLHEMHLHLGIGVPTVSDWIGWQGGVSYVRTAKPSEMYAVLRRMGVSDILWSRTSRAYDSLGGDLAFYSFVTRQARRSSPIGGYLLSHLPDAAPSDEAFHDLALVFACDKTYASGVYRISELSVTVLATPRAAADYPPPSTPLAAGDALEDWLAKVDAVAIKPSCFSLPVPLERAGFERAAERGPLQLWVRSPARSGSHRPK
jgi:hypothetical protein